MTYKAMTTECIEALRKEFNVADESISLFEKIIGFPTAKRREILEMMDVLAKGADLSYALIALFRQQVKCGFVVADPLSFHVIDQKAFYDPDTNITFCLQWNPYREMRLNHLQLIERGVISNNVDQDKLINKDKNGKACYLCKTNIDEQNPNEILFPINLANEGFYMGANFAFITNNHFTVINAKHLPQQYRKGVIEALSDFVDQTDGYFRAIFNGLAGASIKEHEHLQATPEELPIEKIRVEDRDIIFKDKDITVLRPKYYLPVLIIEGEDKTKTNIVADSIISEWVKLDAQLNTVNIISTKISDKKLFRTFVILRNKSKLAGRGKRGAMAAFETGGNIVLSCRSNLDGHNEVDEKHTFDNANLDIVKQMLKDVSPAEESCSCLARLLAFR